MEHERSVRVRLGAKEIQVPYGTTAGEIIRSHGQSAGGQAGHQGQVGQGLAGPVPLAAIVHNRCVDLSFPITAAAAVAPVTYAMREGVLVYRRTVSLVLFAAARQLWGNTHVRIGQAAANGYYFHIGDEKGLTEAQTDELAAKMRELVKQDLPISTEVVMLAEAKRIFSTGSDENKLRLLKTWWETHVTLVRCAGVCDIHHYPVAPRTSYVRHFELLARQPGVLLRFPIRSEQPDIILPADSHSKLRQVHQESAAWLNLLGVASVGQLNDVTLKGEAGELIRVAEGLHEKKIAEIADRICGSENPIGIVLMAGPSSSGKTTFSKRLSLQLKVNGVTPVTLSTDNFYVDRVDTPRDDEGNYDFESIDAIDLDLFNDVVNKLLNGGRVRAPRYDFTRGRRRAQEDWTPMQLKKGQVLLVEGIHGLNPRLTEGVEDAHKFSIYINALTQLCIDDHNRIFTSDTRLLRRIVRDRLFRGYLAKDTIENWPRVRHGEMRWIFPFEEAADVIFNSALLYEHAVLRLYAERFLLEIPEDDPAFVNGYRLLRFIENFVPMFDESIPETSLVREFIGKSFFDY